MHSQFYFCISKEKNRISHSYVYLHSSAMFAFTFPCHVCSHFPNLCRHQPANWGRQPANEGRHPVARIHKQGLGCVCKGRGYVGTLGFVWRKPFIERIGSIPPWTNPLLKNPRNVVKAKLGFLRIPSKYASWWQSQNSQVNGNLTLLPRLWKKNCCKLPPCFGWFVWGDWD